MRVLRSPQSNKAWRNWSPFCNDAGVRARPVLPSRFHQNPLAMSASPHFAGLDLRSSWTCFHAVAELSRYRLNDKILENNASWDARRFWSIASLVLAREICPPPWSFRTPPAKSELPTWRSGVTADAQQGEKETEQAAQPACAPAQKYSQCGHSPWNEVNKWLRMFHETAPPSAPRKWQAYQLTGRRSEKVVPFQQFRGRNVAMPLAWTLLRREGFES